MSRTIRIGLAVLVLSAVGSFLAVSPAREASATTDASVMEAPVPEKEARPVDRARLTPMHLEILDHVESEAAQVEALNRRFIQAVLPVDRLAIQKEIEAIKKSGMIKVLEIQLRYAEEGGRSEAATQLKTAIEAIRNPRPLQTSQPTLLERMGPAGGR